MSCGDTNWGWFRHYFNLCSKCGSLVDSETKHCEYCENKNKDEEEYENYLENA